MSRRCMISNGNKSLLGNKSLNFTNSEGVSEWSNCDISQITLCLVYQIIASKSEDLNLKPSL